MPSLAVAVAPGFNGRDAVIAFVCSAVPDMCKDRALELASNRPFLASEATIRPGVLTFAPRSVPARSSSQRR